MADGDITTRLRQTRANMLGTDDEAHYWDCHDAADEIERLRGLTVERRFCEPTVAGSTPAAGFALTDAEREAIDNVLHHIATRADHLQREAHDLRGLLERMK